MGLKYKNESLRAKWWDYSNAGTYFITICTKDRNPFFGEVLNREVVLSEIGKIVFEEWLKTADLRSKMKVELHNFVVSQIIFMHYLLLG
ncbi:hypothetical protein D3C87_277460 [compost metagenome]